MGICGSFQEEERGSKWNSLGGASGQDSAVEEEKGPRPRVVDELEEADFD